MGQLCRILYHFKVSPLPITFPQEAPAVDTYLKHRFEQRNCPLHRHLHSLGAALLQNEKTTQSGSILSGTAMLVLLTLLACSAGTGSFIRADPQRGFLDSQGRQRVFHGVNVVYKFPPWLPPTGPRWDPFMSLNDRDFAQLQAWGFNFIRVRGFLCLFRFS